MKDFYGRNIEYLRLSLTGCCNLHCSYCRDTSEKPSGSELSSGDIERIIRCMGSLGISKVRLTGGEPLMRLDLEDIVKAVSVHKAITDICMTTNAHGLAPRAHAFKKAGLMRINVSLDSLKKDRFEKITKGGSVKEVFDGIDASLDAGLSPVKLNCVIMKGENDDEIDDFIALAKAKPLHIRFIELMPMGGVWDDVRYVGNDDVFRRHPELVPVFSRTAAGPAVEYTAQDFLGTIGFISPITRPFCNNCNRIRITHDGKLRPCLGDNAEIDLRAPLDRDDAFLLQTIERTIYNKPAGHRFNEGFVSERRMVRIGG